MIEIEGQQAVVSGKISKHKTADVEHFWLLTKSVNQVGKWKKEKNFRIISSDHQ